MLALQQNKGNLLCMARSDNHFSTAASTLGSSHDVMRQQSTTVLPHVDHDSLANIDKSAEKNIAATSSGGSNHLTQS